MLVGEKLAAQDLDGKGGRDDVVHGAVGERVEVAVVVAHHLRLQDSPGSL